MSKKEAKTPAPYKIEKRGDGRYEIVKRGGRARINGPEKIKILVEAGLIKAKVPTAKAPEGEAAAAEAPKAEEAAT